MSIRPAADSEIESAVRLILAGPQRGIDPEQAGEFARIGRDSARTVGGAWVAEQDGRLISAVLPVVSPGRTMLLFAPAYPPDHEVEQVTRQLIEGVCGRAATAEIQLAQSLVDPRERAAYSMYRACAFRQLAVLVYLQANVPRGLSFPPLPDGCGWVSYTPQTHPLFARTILASYEQSLDCPRLNGRRGIEDIIAGHKASGEFDPRHWFLLEEHGQGLGVLLLSALPRNDSMELVYLGLAAPARGRGLGDLLMRQAMAATSASPLARLSLAVDAANPPAMQLYYRHGMQSLARRIALLRELGAAANS